MSYRAGRNEGTLVCDGWCENKLADHERPPVTHIDTAGYSYCTPCGLIRRQYEPCRKMQPWEIRRLERGVPLAHY